MSVLVRIAAFVRSTAEALAAAESRAFGVVEPSPRTARLRRIP